MDDKQYKSQKDWQDAPEPVSDDLIHGLLRRLQLRTTIRDWITVFLNGFGAILGGFANPQPQFLVDPKTQKKDPDKDSDDAPEDDKNQ